MKKRSKKASDADMASYWLEHDSTEEVDWSQPGVRLEFDPSVERPTRSVTVRLPRRLVQELRIANGAGRSIWSSLRIPAHGQPVEEGG